MFDLQPLFADAGRPDAPLIIAGPCSAESRGQVMRIAGALHDIGIRIFRAGVWKPRTRPGSFEGLGKSALPWLAEARDTFGLIPLVEIASGSHIKEAMDAGILNFWIGARTAANPFAVQDIADALAAIDKDKRDRISVLVKNPVNPDIDLWIGEIERIYASGIRRIGAIHRGFGSYGHQIYRNLPEWRIPIELKNRLPELPLICDPSHIGGRRDLIAPLSQQALDMNFDGLIIETHDDPDNAMSDSRQQITPCQLQELIGNLKPRTGASGDTVLSLLRDEIDDIDDNLVSLLARRMDVARRIGALKRENGIPVVQPGRYHDLMNRRVDQASRMDISPDFMRRILSLIHEESVRVQTCGNEKSSPENEKRPHLSSENKK